MKSWDDALSTVTLIEVDSSVQPDIAIGYVDLKADLIQPDALGFWTSWAHAGIRTRAVIKLKSEESAWFSEKHHFIHTMQHEIGNVLGLGDIAPNRHFASVLEDPWQPPYGKAALGATDIALVKQLYGEPGTCVMKGESYLPRSQGKVASLV